MANKILKISAGILTGHEATPEEWQAAQAKIRTGHEFQPDGPLMLKVGPDGRQVLVRSDDQGNLFLEFQD